MSQAWPVQFYLGDGFGLEAFHQDQVQVVQVQVPDMVFERFVVPVPVFHQQRPALSRPDQYLAGAGLAQFITVLTRIVDFKRVVRMLDDAHAQVKRGKDTQQVDQQGRLTGAAPGGKTHQRNVRELVHSTAPPSAPVLPGY